MQKACRRIPGCVYGRDQGFIKEQVTSLGQRNNWFYMRDYAKSGMTIPHAVRNAILRGFYRRRPDLATKYIFAFDKQVVYLKNGETLSGFNPSVGMPLGMFVEGFTLLQYSVDHIITRTLGFNVDFSATNDDMIVGSRSQDRLREYISMDMDIQSDLGMLTKATKSGLSHNKFFFCEEYWDVDSIMSKEALTSLALIGAKYALNVVHAKELTNSIILSLPYISPIVKQAIKEVQTSYEVEFSEQEIHWPYLFGGWMPTYRDGLDASIEWFNGDSVATASYWACRERVSKKRQLQEKPSLTFSRYKHLTLLVRPENEADYMSLIPLFGTKGALSDYFSLMSRRPTAMKRHYSHLWIARQRAFTQIMNGKREVKDVTDGYLKRHTNSVITLGLVGMVCRPAVGIIPNPKLGGKLDSTEAWLSAMHHVGIINYPKTGKVSKTERLLHVQGFTRELEYSKLYVSNIGCSEFIVKNNLRGLDDFQDKYKLAIVKIDDDDLPMAVTLKWLWAPELPLQWVMRCVTYSRPYPDFEFSEETGPWWTSFVQNKHAKIDSWGYEDIVAQPVEDTSTFEQVVYDYLRNMLDGSELTIRAKFIPMATNSVGSGIDVTSHASNEAPNGLVMFGEGNYIPSDRTETLPFWDNDSENGSEFESFPWD